MEIVRYYDTLNENSYHLLMLGLCAYMYKTHKDISNQEKGKGRCDIILESLSSNYPSYILKFKYTKDKSVDLKELAKKAIQKIKDNHHYTGLKGNTYYIGLAHHNKSVEVLFEKK